MAKALETVGLTKVYGQHTVLQDVALSADAGEIVAVIGENGAGKSTFAKCISGATRPTSGSIRLAGAEVALDSPRAAAAHGVAYLPQEPQVVPQLTVAESMLLGRWPARHGLLRRRAAHAVALEQLARIGVALDVEARIGTLRTSERQLVEIARALGSGARVLLLDEPTAALHRAEADRLYGAVARLAAEGVAILFVSHRLDEVQRFAHRVAVLRNGRLVADLPTAGAARETLIRAMLGRAAPAADGAGTRGPAGAPQLVAHALAADGVEPADFQVGSAEVVVLFGVRGSGAGVLAEALGGRCREASGTVTVAGSPHPVPRDPRAARRAGIAYVPEDRKANGVIAVLSVRTNANLLVPGVVSNAGVIRRGRDRRHAAEIAERFDVRHRGLDLPIEHLSGGNQQKVLLGSRAALGLPVLVLHEPTQGVDVGARLRIHELVRATAASGTAVLVVTSDVEEAELLADRLIVVRDGAIVCELAGPAVTQQAALRLATAEDAA